MKNTIENKNKRKGGGNATKKANNEEREQNVPSESRRIDIEVKMTQIY